MFHAPVNYMYVVIKHMQLRDVADGVRLACVVLNVPRPCLIVQAMHDALQLPKAEEDVLEILPTKDKTLDTMVMTQVLSARGTHSLGEWEFQYQYDPFALAAEKEYVHRRSFHPLDVQCASFLISIAVYTCTCTVCKLIYVATVFLFQIP